MKSKQLPSTANSRQVNTNRARLHPSRQSLVGKSLLALLSSAALSQATIVGFDLSPAGTSAAVGLSPANEAPAVIGSTGSGNSISGGITFDTTTSTLSFAVGYGSAAGFTDLTGAATAMHLHGPAAVGVSGSILYDLASVSFPAANPAKGGLIFGSIVYTSAQAVDLLAGLDYLNIHTAARPTGEIRGQLVRANVAPEITCEETRTVECGQPVAYSATVSDFDGNAVQVVWSLNGVTVQTNNLLAGTAPTSQVLSYTTKLYNESNILTVTATDSAGDVTTCDTIVTVEDTVAPVIDSVSADPKVLWPPNHKMIPITVTAKVSDDCSDTTWKIISVSSNQAVDEKGSGNTSPDWRITGDHTVSLRAERSGKIKSDRVYLIKIRATDASGNYSETSTVRVTVPHDQGK